jgi:uncharacterized protein YoxC
LFSILFPFLSPAQWCISQATAATWRHLSTRPQVTPEEAQEILRKTKAVCFDVDSTVSMDEGIDVLADFAGCGQAVADLTKR